MVIQAKSFRKIQRLARDYVTFYNPNRLTLIVMFVVWNLKYGAMKIKQHVPTVEQNGNAPTKTQHASHTANTQINAEQ
jgi:hypothetical protein